jgi:hypothetical protein
VVIETSKRMEGGNVMGPDVIPVKVQRCLGDIAII